MFWHEYAKIPRVACKHPIAEGDFYWIFARNIYCTIERRANLYLAIRRYLCYYVYNNRNEVKRGQKFRGKIW